MKKLISLALFILVLSPYHNGDLNQDGNVTIIDLVIMRQMVEGFAKQNQNADMNYDGRVDEKDLNILRQILAYK